MQNNGHDSRVIANIFVQEARKAGHILTILPLVKYVYFAHGWHLGYLDEPLISDKVQAWKYGPVVPKIYYTFRDNNDFAIRKEAKDEETKQPYRADLSERSRKIVVDVYKEYSQKSAWGLSNSTHHESSPWYKYRHQTYATIPNEEIESYYKEIIERMRANSASENS